MKERRPGFSPKIRQKEVIPVAPEGMEITRVNGKLYAVPEKGSDPYFGNSAYTRNQLDVIFVIAKNNPIFKKSMDRSGGSW